MSKRRDIEYLFTGHSAHRDPLVKRVLARVRATFGGMTLLRYDAQNARALHASTPARSRLIISFDPGVTTGIAVLDEDGTPLETYAVATNEVEEFAKWAVETYPDADAIIESPPEWGGNMRPVTQGVEETLKRYFPDAVWAYPGQWKGHPATRPDSSLRGKTQHEKDAVGLGRWFKATRSK